MHPAGHAAEQALGGGGGFGKEAVHIVPAGKIQVAPQFAIKRVLHGHIHHGAALIHHGVQFGAHLLGGLMDTGQNAGVTAGGRVELVAPGRGFDLRPAGPQQGHIPHHDLTADPQLGGQHTGADGRFGPIQFFQDLFPALCGIHWQLPPCTVLSLL